jgi:hypothetical protein
MGGRFHIVRGIVRECGSSFSSGELCHPWAITVRVWVGSLFTGAALSLSVSVGGSSSVSGRS